MNSYLEWAVFLTALEDYCKKSFKNPCLNVLQTIGDMTSLLCCLLSVAQPSLTDPVFRCTGNFEVVFVI